MADTTTQRGSFWLWLIPVAIFAVGLGLSAFVYVKSHAADEARVEGVLELRVEWRVHDLRSKIDDALVPVEALADFVASQDLVEPGAFHRFAVLARGDDPMSSLAWLPWVPGNERGTFEATARRNGYADFEIKEGDPLNPTHFVRAPDRADYAPIMAEVIFVPRTPLIGFDMIADPNRRAAAERARDQGTAIATQPAMPAFRADRAPISIVFWPIYRNGMVPATVAERRESIRGFAIGALRITDVVNFDLRGSPDATAKMSILFGDWHGEPDAVPAIVVRPGVREAKRNRDPIGPPEPGGFRLVRTFPVFGLDRNFVFDYSRDAVAPLRSSAPWFYLASGSLLTILLASYVALELFRRRRIENLVAERTRDLAASNESLRHEVEGRKADQAELVRASDQLKAMIEASPAGIVCVDPELRVLIWNKSAERIFGYNATEVVGRANPLIPEDEREIFIAGFGRVLHGTVLRGQIGHRRKKDGTVIETRYSASAFHDSSGVVQGAVYACEDATESSRLQNQLLRAQKLETVGQLTGGLAHDFNNILGAVIGNLDLLTERVTRDPAAAGYCREALEAALSGGELVKRMLAFSRRQPLRPKAMDINATIENIRALVQRTIGEHIAIKIQFADALWPATADPVQLESAVLNLAVNARDAMPDGGTITITTENKAVDDVVAGAELEPGDYVVISVADTGTGIAPDVLAHAFEPFFTTKAPGKGSGLGLSMVFGTMKQLGGTARIYSEVGAGTMVRLYLPRALTAAESAAEREAHTDTLPRGTERVLLVEDNGQIRAVGAGILEGLGYRVTTSENGDAAMGRIERGEAFDLLFTDVMMPGKLNGIGLAHALRTRDPNVRILFASGFTSPMTVRTDMDKLGAELLLKPYRRQELARAIRRALDDKVQVRA